MDYMIRFTQVHETFRLAEIQALAELQNVNLEVLSYSPSSPYCVIKVLSDDDARKIVKRSILAKAVYEIWGTGTTYEELHDDVRRRSQHLWNLYKQPSFKFTVDSFQGTRTMMEQKQLIEEFHYLGFDGPIRMKNPDHEFRILEDWKLDTVTKRPGQLRSVHLGRLVSRSGRGVISKYDLKTREYISTTSMDAELALVTANISLAAPGKLFYDPFVGTGSFPIACAHFGAVAWGSDIDGRSIRGKEKTGILTNFIQYDLVSWFGDSFVADLTNSPVRGVGFFDGIVCDPPYGVREGLKVLGNRDPAKGKEPVFQNGEAHHLQEGYVPPKKPYGFVAMLEDILDFAALSLVENGRLSFWMPTANEEDQELLLPDHPFLEMTSSCTQSFSKWSRRLLTYRRLPATEVTHMAIPQRSRQMNGVTADDLNPFRKQFFQGFRSE